MTHSFPTRRSADLHRADAAYGYRNADPRHVRLLAQGDGDLTMAEPTALSAAAAASPADAQPLVDRLNALYGSLLDDGASAGWLGLFTDDRSEEGRGGEEGARWSGSRGAEWYYKK